LTRVAAALLIATLATATAAQAEDPAPQDQAAFADVTVDGVAGGERTIAIESDGDVLVTLDDARALQIPVPPAARRSRAGRAYVSLRALSPDVGFRFDEASVALTVHVAARLMALQTLVVERAPAAPTSLDTSRPASAFGNYFVSGSTGNGVNGFFEAGRSRANRLLYTSESLQSSGPAVRGETYYAIDDPARTRRVQLGDVTAFGDALAADVRFFGISTRRAFELDPYVYRFSSPVVSGIVGAPGIADVYVNGVVARSVPLLPGGFDLTNLPVATGRNDVAVVVRDAAGAVQTYSQAYYRSDTLLRKGLTDDQFGLGFVRGAAPAQSYGNLALFGAYRIGATNASTFGVRLKATAAHEVGELSADFRIPSGAVHLAAAASEAAGRVGTAYEAALMFSAPTTTLSAAFSSHASGFRDLGSAPLVLEPARDRATVTFSQRLGRAVSASFQAQREVFAALPAQTIATLGASALVGRNTSAFLSLQRSQVGSGAPSAYVSLSLVRALGAGRTVVASLDRGASATSAFAYRADARSPESGLGYGVRYDRTSVGPMAAFDVVDHAPQADLHATLARDPSGSISDSLAVDGGIASIGGRTLWTRPVSNAFALVDVGAAGVAVSLDGRPVGRTNRRGELVIGSLAPNTVNRIAVSPDDLALDQEVQTGERLLSPGFRGGSIARLAVSEVRYVTGSVRLQRAFASFVPADGMLTISAIGKAARSPLDDDGGYYFENLAAGNYDASVRSGAGSCRFTFTVPNHGNRIGTDLGVQRCVQS